MISGSSCPGISVATPFRSKSKKTAFSDSHFVIHCVDRLLQDTVSAFCNGHIQGVRRYIQLSLPGNIVVGNICLVEFIIFFQMLKNTTIERWHNLYDIF